MLEQCLQENIQIANSPWRFFLLSVFQTLSYFCHYFINENNFVRSIKSKIPLAVGLVDSTWDNFFLLSPSLISRPLIFIASTLKDNMLIVHLLIVKALM